VAATWTGRFTFPRYSVILYPSIGCGEAALDGCFAVGTVLFKEDFGGNTRTAPVVSPTGLPAGVTTYPYSMTPNRGSHNIVKYIYNPSWNTGSNRVDGYWHNISDHTNAGDSTRGYFCILDPDTNYSAIMYQHTISGLCPGVSLSFSVSLINLDYRGQYDKPNVTIRLYDPATDELLAVYVTGEITEYVGRNNPNLRWGQYGFQFTPHTDAIKMVLSNYSTAGNGNDLGMDDIETRVCLPGIELKFQNTVC
jgi:hypothetical protein